MCFEIEWFYCCFPWSKTPFVKQDALETIRPTHCTQAHAQARQSVHSNTCRHPNLVIINHYLRIKQGQPFLDCFQMFSTCWRKLPEPRRGSPSLCFWRRGSAAPGSWSWGDSTRICHMCHCGWWWRWQKGRLPPLGDRGNLDRWELGNRKIRWGPCSEWNPWRFWRLIALLSQLG